MKFKRGIFIGTLMVLFLGCFHIMNQHYDELARYQYVNDDNRKLILEYMSTEDINYLIDRQYKPEDFMGYLGFEGFNIRFVDWYNTLKEKNDLSIDEIIKLTNEMRQSMDFSQFKMYCKNYSSAQLNSFFLSEEGYVHEYTLIADPQSISEIKSTETLFTYEPQDLIEVEGVPVINAQEHEDELVLIREVGENLINMCNAAYEMNEKSCGNMLITQGYLSFSQQEALYEQALLNYGLDDVLLYVDYPGQSIYQLGNVIKLVPATVENVQKENEMSLQQNWLVEHAQKYGFKFLNDSSKPQSEFILQYDASLKESNHVVE